jgi:hypothetical protein
MDISKYSKLFAVVLTAIVLKGLMIFGITPEMSVQDAVTAALAVAGAAVFAAPKNK